MSYIDTFNHSHVGMLFGIQVYHPFNNNPNSELNSDMLIIGGGSGEHNMFIVEGLNKVLIEYITHFTEDENTFIPDELFKKYNFWETSIETDNQWSIDECAKVAKGLEFLKEKFSIDSTERLILLSLGKFLKDNGKYLIEDELLEIASKLKYGLDEVVRAPFDNELSGRYFLHTRPINQISLRDEMKIRGYDSIN